MTSTVVRCACKLDLVPGDQAVSQDPIDLTPALGEWSTTNLSTWGISRAELIRRNGGVDMHVIAADPSGEPHDWGRVPVERLFTAGPGSSRVRGYTATFDLGHARTHIQANVDYGLNVIAALTTFTDGSGRLDYLSREFFHRRVMQAAPARASLESEAAPAHLAAARGDDRLPMLRTSIDPAPLLYRWRNTDDMTLGLAEVHCELRDRQLVVRVVANGPQGPIDWGEVVAALYTDITITGAGRASADAVTGGRPTPNYADVSTTDAGPAFWATYEHGFQRVDLQGRINLGVMVLAIFTQFTDDSGRVDHFRREVFIREA